MHSLLAMLCGSLVGFSLGLIGGGGSILAVPLLIYVVGVRSPHVAIGTSALAVGINALVNLFGHWRRGNVNWACAAVFAAAGVLGAYAGSSLGKLVDGQKLLILFALVMLAVGAAMLRPRASGGDPGVRLVPRIAVRLFSLGFLTGGISGFFGIGGGFLIVPGIMFASGMTVLDAIGSSLLSVAAFGLTTAANYASSGLVDWRIALEFIAGGALGGWLGVALATRLGAHKHTLSVLFAVVVFAVAAYMLARALRAP
ncbi:MAG: sulfite exporter TauE/SafE family protein [Gammaproteobacteria bacterium]|nr:sulfite exporter TauE/SafE family protein [Gammaproteobacteria bacterium]MDE2251630.1 sulfite exporter TauE/SafE family protein [Gammaproteobacteria bacterium]